jgi:hypothetical protein
LSGWGRPRRARPVPGRSLDDVDLTPCAPARGTRFPIIPGGGSPAEPDESIVSTPESRRTSRITHSHPARTLVGRLSPTAQSGRLTPPLPRQPNRSARRPRSCLARKRGTLHLDVLLPRSGARRLYRGRAAPRRRVATPHTAAPAHAGARPSSGPTRTLGCPRAAGVTTPPRPHLIHPD